VLGDRKSSQEGGPYERPALEKNHEKRNSEALASDTSKSFSCDRPFSKGKEASGDAMCNSDGQRGGRGGSAAAMRLKGLLI